MPLRQSIDQNTIIAIGVGTVGGVGALALLVVVVCMLQRAKRARGPARGRGEAPLKMLDREQASATYDIIPDAPASAHYLPTSAAFKIEAAESPYETLPEAHYAPTGNNFQQALNAPESAYGVFTPEETGPK